MTSLVLSLALAALTAAPTGHSAHHNSSADYAFGLSRHELLGYVNLAGVIAGTVIVGASAIRHRRAGK